VPVRPTARFVLLHGLYTSRTMWRPQHAALREAGFLVAVPDMPGHGRRRGEPFELETAIEAIDAAVTAIRASPLAPPGPVILAGLSLGGYLAMEYAGRHPDRIDGLIPMGCATRPVAFGLAVYRTMTRTLTLMPDRGLALDMAAQRLIGGEQAVRAMMGGGYAIDVALDALNAVEGLDPIASLGRVAEARLPTWFVNGQFDQMRLEQQRFAEAAGGAWRTIVPGAPHVVNLAAPGRVSRILLRVGEAAC